MKPDKKFLQQLNRELDGELDEPARRALYRRLRDDVESRRVAADWRKLSGAMRDQPAHVPSRDLVEAARLAHASGRGLAITPRNEIVPTLRWFSAAAAILVLVGGFLVSRGPSTKIFAGSETKYDATIRSLFEGDVDGALVPLTLKMNEAPHLNTSHDDGSVENSSERGIGKKNEELLDDR